MISQWTYCSNNVSIHNTDFHLRELQTPQNPHAYSAATVTTQFTTHEQKQAFLIAASVSADETVSLRLARQSQSVGIHRGVGWARQGMLDGFGLFRYQFHKRVTIDLAVTG